MYDFQVLVDVESVKKYWQFSNYVLRILRRHMLDDQSPENRECPPMLEKEEKISEGQEGFRPNRSRIDHVYTLGKIIQGRKDAGLTTYCSF